MKLFVKPIEKAKVDEIKRIFYKYEAKGEMLQKVIEHQEDGINEKMFQMYSDSYEDAAMAYKEEFLKYTAMVPDGVEMEHDIRVSVSFIYNRLEVQQACDCDIDNAMKEAGFERIL